MMPAGFTEHISVPHETTGEWNRQWGCGTIPTPLLSNIVLLELGGLRWRWHHLIQVQRQQRFVSFLFSQFYTKLKSVCYSRMADHLTYICQCLCATIILKITLVLAHLPLRGAFLSIPKGLFKNSVLFLFCTCATINNKMCHNMWS